MTGPPAPGTAGGVPAETEKHKRALAPAPAPRRSPAPPAGPPWPCQCQPGGRGAENLVLRVFSEAAVPCPVCVCWVLAFSASLQDITV